ncbi:serine palmitoyltransferase-like protein [Sarcoptes scabiei]|uniref:Serine palmitoyltransferase-like protein n=1 Tax=Sarcoptes scabiei TaxID=52283 RepID=A0A132A912_SARSC|nr:serine palmitoyltransferase-like protein [Sarcoptes scabiei]
MLALSHILSTATVNETRTFSTNKNYLQNHVSETALSNNQNHAHNSSIIKKSQRTAPSDNQKHSKAAIYVEPLRPEIPFHMPGYTKLYTTFAPFYYRNIILRLINMFQIPICSAPGGYTDFLEREFKPYNSEWKFTGRKIRAINMGSYDYLGHSTNSGSRIESVVHIIKKYGVSVGSSPNELDMKNLEQIIRTAIIDGQPDSGEPWRKIIILIEGIYSMEGTIVDLPEVIRIKKKYKAYLYMDEAHSIGAMGNRGRGIYDYYGCDPREIDILMAAFYYGSTMSPALCQQISCILDEFLEIDNKSVNHLLEQPIEKRIKQLRRNVVRFRTQLRQLGFHIDGSDDSPVVPMMVYTPTNLKYYTSSFKELDLIHSFFLDVLFTNS